MGTSMTAFKRIMIFGIPGSGKSTFSLYLSDLLNLPVEHLDKSFFVENWIERDYEDFLRIQENFVNKDSWIIDGNATRSLEIRFKRADVALYFRFNRLLCLWRLFKRRINKNSRIFDRAEGCSEQIRWKLIRYLWGFNKRVEKSILHLKEKYPHVQFYELRNNQDLEKFMKNLKKIEIVEYNPKWPEQFLLESEKIKEALGPNCVQIHHIGSTSVPGLSAKPIIDMLPMVKNIQEVDFATKKMQSLGYEAKGEGGMAFRRYFQKEKFHVHVYQEEDPEISRYLKFRDWMRSHPEEAESYGKLKLELAQKFPYDILQYCNGKDAFVASIDLKDGFDGYRMVKALTDREWKAVYALRKSYFSALEKDPYNWTFTHKDHIHFVFYKTAEIVGTLHLEILPGHKTVLRMIAIDKTMRNLGLGSQFLRLCERWLCHQKCAKLLVASPKELYPFYRKLGFQGLPAKDPDHQMYNFTKQLIDDSNYA